MDVQRFRMFLFKKILKRSYFKECMLIFLCMYSRASEMLHIARIANKYPYRQVAASQLLNT